ncbi:N-terminal C2 in EEIG1 and EHBP1 proteins-domain-containing protein [Colletotrichum phormii]|uniref:N-terminal C2 in EEIG1 and EHBP1 proteins-domain-containing protein n=1 Tax=Colletotrichum phormii TaxID=359342 RepID=A0AAJ0ELA3_9PEZI|nr:N-terminal C2 in EEIG1 and EHBP1 proteins-domain-containing protein [Colletotrichum phormii]KAK1656101.1 N-terminal C2 in EEIG1 and EHBP1 proteins-domain-containing protein [Colletotrichum phormii]
MASLINKNRKPKFELHLKIFDLNNVPLVSGTSIVKWNLAHSIHAEHRGRTPQCPISNHKVEYNYSKVVSHIRISIDKNNNLTECPVEFEVLQQFPGSGREEKISLGLVKLNLSEYVEESDGLTRESSSFDRGHSRKRSSGTSQSPMSTRAPVLDDPDVEDGILRRYLMQESKINSTLKIGILMMQLDGDKNYSAPPLKTAPVFGGIAGIMAGESVEQDDAGQLPTMAKSRDASEVQDMYRRALAASWSCQAGELPADQCIEDIFSGGDGWQAGRTGRTGKKTTTFDLDNGGSLSSDEGGLNGTLRPSDFRKLERKQQQQQQQQQQQLLDPPQQDHLHLHRLHNGHRHHSRNNSGSSEKSMRSLRSIKSMATIVTGRGDTASSTAGASNVARRGSHSRTRGRDDDQRLGVGGGGGNGGGIGARDYGRSRSRSGSMVSLAPTMGSSDRGRESSRRNRELEEFDVRDDLVAWRLPGAVT